MPAASQQTRLNDQLRILDNPKDVNQQPAAAKVLAALLQKLHSASARGRGGSLALVRTMIDRGGLSG